MFPTVSSDALDHHVALSTPSSPTVPACRPPCAPVAARPQHRPKGRYEISPQYNLIVVQDGYKRSGDARLNGVVEFSSNLVLILSCNRDAPEPSHNHPPPVPAATGVSGRLSQGDA
eukprot:2112444-Rhodomonas_salina.2